MIQSLTKTLIKSVIPSPVSESQRVVRWMAARRLPRALLCLSYDFLSQPQKAAAHGLFAKLFRGYEGPFAEGSWTNIFCGRPVIVPLRRETAWLDWDMALSLLGHDSDLTRFCEHVLQRARPRLVLDVGANYGQFSIRWLVHGVRTVSFEPNARCHSYLRTLCRTNGVNCEIAPVALSSCEGTATLSFTPGEEWLGTISQNSCFTNFVQVPQLTLDAYVEEHKLIPDLLKIDTEGSDLAVLQGGVRTLIKHKPIVIFESLDTTERHEFYNLLRSSKYAICALSPMDGAPEALDALEFRQSTQSNFVACPVEMLRVWPPVF